MSVVSEKKAEQKIKITLSEPEPDKPWKEYWDDWKYLNVAHASPEVQDLIDSIENIGIDRWKVVEYALEQLLTRDRLELAKDIMAWDTERRFEFKTLTLEKAKQEGAKK